MRVIEGDATRIDLRRAVSEGPAKVVASLPYNVAMPILVAGLGNIYVNEILFVAGVHPARRTSRLSRPEAERIVSATSAVLSEALASRGSSISDYRDVSGAPGEFQQHFRVYDRDGEACVRCGGIIRRRVIVGRSSFFCPRCQR